MNALPFRRLVPFLAILLGAAALGACKKPSYPACKKDAQCRTEYGEVCVDGTCQGCQTNADCSEYGDDLICHEFRCQTPEEVAGKAPAGELGSPCTERSDCTGGLACTAGVCTSCTEDFECAPYTCNLDSGRCDPMGACESDSDCPEGEICDASMCVFSGGTGNPGVCGLDSVYFAFDSSVITPTNERKLESAAECLMDEGTAVYLEAHADNVGTEEYNIMLTERRGRSVVDFLTDRGVADGQLQVIAKGALESMGTTEPERAKDRRVDFIAQ